MHSFVSTTTNAKLHHHSSIQDGNEDHELEYNYEMTEDDEEEPSTSSSYGDVSFHIPLHSASASSPRSQRSTQLHSAASNYSYEEDKILGSLQDRFPFLKEERKRTRKLLTPEQTRVLEAILEKTVYPSTPLREAVARQLGIPPRKVQIWFQNKRQGRRRVPGSDSPNSTHGHIVGQQRQSRSGTVGHHHHHHQEHSSPQYQHYEEVRLPSAGISSQARLSTIVRPRAQSDLTSIHAHQHERYLPMSSSAGPLQRSFTSKDKHFNPVKLLQDGSPRSDASFTRRFDSAASLKSPPLQILPPPPKMNRKYARPAMPTWTPTSSNHRERPPPLSFHNHTRTSSSESLGASIEGFRDDWYSSTRSARSSSSSVTLFSDTTVRSEKTSDRGSPDPFTPSSLVTNSTSEGLQLAPIKSLDVGSAASKRCEVLPKISELVHI